MADYESVASRHGIRETHANLDRESVVQTLFQFTVKSEERSRSKRCAFVTGQKNLHEILERKVDSAVRGSESSSVKNVWSWGWGKKLGKATSENFREINQDFESQRFQLHQASRWADQAHRDKISLYGELEMRNRLFQGKSSNILPRNWWIEKIMLRRNWSTNWRNDCSKQARNDELSLHSERNPTTVSELMTQIQDLQTKVNSLADAREFYDRKPGCSSGATDAPDQTSTIMSPRTLPRCDSGLPRDTWNTVGTAGNAFERQPAREGLSCTVFNNSKNSASSS